MRRAWRIALDEWLGERPAPNGAEREERSPVIVRLRGAPPLPPETLLAVAEGMRRALRVAGVTRVRIELEQEDDLAS